MSNVPKAFISYSWTSETHEAWVLELATRLMQDGVAVVLDKWDLKVGHDANAFMEAMVSDPAVTKVLMICDKVYTEKANGRMGGVGKEAQILTREIYEKTKQEKYAALITERDEHGRPYLPAYYGGRQFIDFSQLEHAEERYEELLRWIWNKPRLVKPKLGQPPAFITDPEAVISSTTSSFKRAMAAIRAAAPGAGGLLVDFGDTLIAEFEAAAPDTSVEPFDEEVIRAAGMMRPALRHLIELALAEARFGGGAFDRILHIFERMGRLMYRPEHIRSWSEENYDPYRMMCYEGFLGLVAIMIAEQRFDLLQRALTHPYLIEGRDRGDGPATTTFRVFAQDVPSMEMRKRRLESRRYDMYSDLIAETYQASFPSLAQLIQADILLYLRAMIITDETGYESWWPRLIIYARRHAILELFARSESRAFFEVWASKVFGPIGIADFKTSVEKLVDQFRGSYGYPSPNIAALTNSQQIGSRA